MLRELGLAIGLSWKPRARIRSQKRYVFGKQQVRIRPAFRQR